MTQDPDRVEAIFSEALGKGAPEERSAFLEEACGGDLELKRRVEVLLRAHDRAGGFLEKPVAGAPDEIPALSEEASAGTTKDVPDLRPAEAPGSRIGPYKLLQVIGEGGMGSVWMAEQTEPVRRKVALKVIRPGMDSKQVLARFEAERQALALMDHPNIAKVLDAGATAGGRPYFVMELVKGIPITRFCDEERLSIRERLDLFVPVCQAIQHAHQKGVIHRDIKPSNVLVALYDGRPVPKVIDFGVAKATGPRLTERTLFTEFGAIIGTFEYMSPEQAEMNQLDIDTRSDIYSLGVLLYELLTGTTPLTREFLARSALSDVLRRIREEEPQRPSLRISESRGAMASISAQRKLEPRQLAKVVEGDLDWIVIKALEKDRNRRYETANGLAGDVLQYLQDEPVLARPPSLRYRLRKLARKHRSAVIGAVGFLSLLLVALVVSTALALWANRERERALEAEGNARGVLEFFQDRVLAAARPEGQEGGLGRDATIRAAVDAAEPLIEKSFGGRPLVEASIRNVVGKTYFFLGENSMAIREQERALELQRTHLGLDHEDALTSMNELGLAYQAAGRLPEALQLLEEVLRKRISRYGAGGALTLASMNNLARAYEEAGRNADALRLFEEALKLHTEKFGGEHADTLTILNNLAVACRRAGRTAEAVRLLEEALKLRTAKLGPDHPHTLASLVNLAQACQYAGDLDRAVRLFEDARQHCAAKLGQEHPDTLTSMNNLAMAYRDAGRPGEAIPLLEETLRFREAKLGPEHPHTLISMHNLALGYVDAGRLEDALPLEERALKGQAARFGRDHPDTITMAVGLGKAYVQARRFADAAPLLGEGVEWQRKRVASVSDPARLKEESLVLANLLAQLGDCWLREGKHAAAEAALRECVSIREKEQPDAWSTGNSRSLLGGALLGQNRYAEAEPLIISGYEDLKRREGTIPRAAASRLEEAARRIPALYEAWGKREKLSEWRGRLDPSEKGTENP